MYYELYLDVFFLVNFMMDIVVLFVAKKMLKCPAAYKTVISGAFLGALLTSAVMTVQIESGALNFMILHGPISILMIKTGLRIKWDRSFLKAYITVYCSAFLIGGIFSSMSQYMREGSIFIVFALISYQGAKGVWEWIYHLGKCETISCEVLLCQGTNRIKAKAIIDTGNRLRDYVTGKPVSIISKKKAVELWEDIPVGGVRYIPYHTIGKKDGILPLLVLDEMILYLEDDIQVLKPLIAICEEQDNMGNYEMILNSEVR